MSDEVNFYEVLGIPVGSKDTAIKRAYRRKVFQYHPDTRDHNLDDKENKLCDLKLAQVQEAYEILSDPETKEDYDKIISVLEEQETVEWDSSGFQHPGVWNIPTPMPPTPYGARGTSSSSYFVPSSSYPMNSGSTSVYIPIKSRISIHVDDAVSLGLVGILAGDILNVSYTINSAVPVLGINIVPNAVINMPCRVISVHYGTAPGIPVYADFELEEI